MKSDVLLSDCILRNIKLIAACMCKALAVYAPRVKAKVDLLLSKIAEHGGQPIDMTEYAMFFGFDVMGDIGM